MWGWGYGWGWPMGLGMGLAGLFWLAVIGLLIWALVHFLSGRAPVNYLPPGQGPSALEILSQRFARGEIDSATYERMRSQLQTPQTPQTQIIEPTQRNDLSATQ